MKNGFIFAHNEASEGAKELATALGFKRVRRTNSRFRGNPEKVVINWGAGTLTDEVTKCRIINTVDGVNVCSNKLSFFEHLKDSGVRTVPFTNTEAVAKEWLANGRTVVARRVLRGSGGEGLEIFDGTQAFVSAPLYTTYVKKKDEYRVHVFEGKVIDVQRKALRLVPVTASAEELGRREGVRGIGEAFPRSGRYEIRSLDDKTKEAMVAPDIPGQDHRIRNLKNGYIFARNEVTPPDDVLGQAEAVFNVIPLDFGAVDVIWNDKKKQAFVLEVNTAPGLEGSTIEAYAKAFKEMV